MRRHPNAQQSRDRLAASEAKSQALLVRIEELDKAIREHMLKGGHEKDAAWIKAEIARLEKSRAAMISSVTKNRRLLAAALTFHLDLRPK